ncbi:MAG TPA: hypothetical protein VFP22_02240 [Candidatus Limnocylindrales bacterium]|nr:hypothetical protein [Candidatus Limnocylindrales bacterium]
METSHALRETSDALLRDLEVLGTIEDEKRTLDPGDPRLVELAGRVQEIAERILAGSVRQHELTQVANVLVESGAANAPSGPISSTPRAITSILAEWRDAERRYAAAEPGSAEALETRATADSLRLEYQQAYEAARGR